MTRLFSLYCRSLEAIMALLLASMVVMVFANVVLRYGFNSGIAVSEEVSRWLFVWMTFLGAIVAVREHAHLGTDVLIRRLPVWGKKMCLFVSHVLMLYATWLLLSGSWQQTLVNWDVKAPTSGTSVAFFYFVGVVFAVSTIIFMLHDLWRVMTGQLRDDELVMVHESEEQADIDRINAATAHRDVNNKLQNVSKGSDTRDS